MKDALKVFVSSGVFSTTIAVVYWFLTKEPAGTFLLGMMAAMMTMVSVYMVFAELGSNLASDKPDGTFEEAAGTHVGTFVTNTPLPIAIAILVASVLLGLVVSPAVAVLGMAAFATLIGLMIVGSR